MTFTLAQDAVETANSGFLLWGGVLLAAAIGLLVLEIFVPSGGIIGLLAGVAAIGSVVAFFRYHSALGIAAFMGYIILTPVVAVFGFKLWINSPLARRMVLGGETGTRENDADAPRTEETARRARLESLRALIGASGVAETDLRPVGVVKINDDRLDAMAEMGVIEAGTPVVVTDVYDNQIKVRSC